MFWLLWMMLQWTWWCSYLFKIMISFPSEKFLPSEVGIYCQVTELHGSVLLIFWRTSMLFSIVTALIYIPTNNAPGFLLSTPIPLPTLAISYLFDNNNRCLTIKLSTPENLSLLKFKSPFYYISAPIDFLHSI